MIPLLLLAPLLLAFILIVILPSGNKTIPYIALLAALASFLMAFLVDGTLYTFNWFSVFTYHFPISVQAQGLNMLLVYITTFIGALVMFYSMGYIDLAIEQRRFYLEMLTFEGAMIAFSVAANLIVLFIAWEFLSMSSYFLIQFWHDKKSAAKAARKSVSIVMLGDIALFAAIIVLWHAFGTFSISTIASEISGSSASIIAGVLLLIAIFTKSAQFPFSEWLPDAMEGPTPVSAYLHSSTMIKAGVFAAIILSPILSAASLMEPLMIIGLISAILAALNASIETQVKRVLAYSTVEELGLMFAAIGFGAFQVAIYFFFVQALYKALLFFIAGIGIKATGRETIRDITGLTTNKLVFVSTVFGVLSLAGFFPFSGFFANVAMGSSFATNLYLYALISGISIFTSFYIFRWFIPQVRDGKEDEIHFKYKLMPKQMVYAAAILALCTLLASGAAFFGFTPFTSYTTLNASQIPFSFAIKDSGLAMAFALSGAVVSYALFAGKMKSGFRGLGGIFRSDNLINPFYEHLSAFVMGIGSAVNLLDLYINDLFDSIGRIASAIYSWSNLLASGKLNTYSMAFGIGIVLLLAWFYLVIK